MTLATARTRYLAAAGRAWQARQDAKMFYAGHPFHAHAAVLTERARVAYAEYLAAGGK